MRIMTRGLGFPLFIMLSGLKPRVLRCKRLRQSYCSSSPAKGNDSEVLNKQLLKAGMSYLKDTEKTRKSVELRKLDINIDQLLVDYGKYQQILGKLDNALLEKKAEAGVVSSKGDVNEKGRSIDKLRDLKGTIKQLKTELHQMEKSLVPNVSRLPNNIHPNVPIGNEPRLVEYLNAKPDFNFPALDYREISKRHNLIDFQSAAKCSGERSYYLKREAALLEISLVQYAMNKAVEKGFIPVITPDIINTDIADRCGFQPRSHSTQMYSLANEDKCLSATAEIPLAGMYLDEKIFLHDLPIKLVAFGRCFRVETGNRGKGRITGLYRVHQFSKVELFGLTANEDGTESEALLNEIVSLQKEIHTELGLHCRVLDMPTTQLGATAYRKYDIEAWMPGLKRYGEVTSASNCTDYQSQRLNIIYGKAAFGHKKKKLIDPKYVHTVNGTACAIPRTIIALLETHQKEDGSFALPDVLSTSFRSINTA